MAQERILLFDMLRIVAIIMVVLGHIGATISVLFVTNLPTPLLQAIMPGALAQWGAALFIFISGCVLEYAYGQKVWGDTASKFDYYSFMIKRLLRLYPAFWFTMVLGLVILLCFGITSIDWLSVLKELTGFWAFFSIVQSNTPFNGYVIGTSWFIGVIICLYLIYPIITKFLKNNGFAGLVLILLVVMFIRISPGSFQDQYWYWSPLSRLAEFSLGIYIVQARLYYKTTNNLKVIRFASDLCFPIFLVSSPILLILWRLPTACHLNLILYFLALISLALLVHTFDINFKKYFESRNRANNSVDKAD